MTGLLGRLLCKLGRHHDRTEAIRDRGTLVGVRVCTRCHRPNMEQVVARVWNRRERRRFMRALGP